MQWNICGVNGAFILFLPLAVLLCYCVNAACIYFVAALSGTAGLGSSPNSISLQSWIKFNSLQSTAQSKAVGSSIYWQNAACCLVIPSSNVAYAQLRKYRHQSSKRQASMIVPYDMQRNSCIFCIFKSRRTQQNSYFISHLLGTVTTKWLDSDGVVTVDKCRLHSDYTVDQLYNSHPAAGS